MREYLLVNADQIGEVLGMERHRSKMSQRTLAEEAQVARSFVGMLECKGKKDITLSKVLRLLSALGCEVVIRRRVRT